ncbi:hypothetical protein [Streptomyces sp. NRRL F-5053]|uniref:hypothetical protein n=1 Tax=Streptomyces sp. NRRL F-5053 TaxID=1463854 RepID=UPI000AFA1290
MKRHADLQNAFYERVHTKTQQVPESEKRLRETRARLKKTIADQKTEIEELKQRVTDLALAGPVLTQQRGAPAEPDLTSGNVIPVHRVT